MGKVGTKVELLGQTRVCYVPACPYDCKGRFGFVPPCTSKSVGGAPTVTLCVFRSQVHLFHICLKKVSVLFLSTSILAKTQQRESLVKENVWPGKHRFATPPNSCLPFWGRSTYLKSGATIFSMANFGLTKNVKNEANKGIVPCQRHFPLNFILRHPKKGGCRYFSLTSA